MSLGACTIVNIYNDCKHNQTLEEIERFLVANISKLRPEEHEHMIWLGDFNQHHPLWDEERCHAPNVFGTVDMEKVSQ